MTIVRTVLGDISPTELGFCDAHDHVLIRGGVGVVKTPDLDISSRQAAVAELNDFRSAGGRSMVDCMPIDCGRDAEGLVEASQMTGVHIVASTGFHTPHYYTDEHWSYSFSVDAITELLIAEVEVGMDRYGYGAPVVDRMTARAGVVKVATELDHVAPVTAKLMEAAAACHDATGVPIITHTERGTLALEQVELLGGWGVRPESILISHVDRNTDLGVHRALAESGAYLIYDGPSRTKYHTVEEVAEMIELVCERGATDRVLLGLDLALRSYRTGYGGSPGFLFLHEHFLPLLRERGADEVLIGAITEDNPARALTFASRRSS